MLAASSSPDAAASLAAQVMLSSAMDNHGRTLKIAARTLACCSFRCSHGVAVGLIPCGCHGRVAADVLTDNVTRLCV
jgi:hypothetical protein